jgi:hypothetical protein
MKVYLIECGTQKILFIPDFTCYHILNKKLWELFNSEKPDFSTLENGLKLKYTQDQQWLDNNNIDETTLLKHFYDPEHNFGAIIAMRDSEIKTANIYQRHLFQY